MQGKLRDQAGGRVVRPESVPRPKLAVQVLPARLSPPLLSGVVQRSELLGLLAGQSETPLITVAAPPGYGKTTLLAEWVEHDPRPFGWLTLDRSDDPAALLTYLALALNNAIEVEGLVFDRLATPHETDRVSALSGLASSISTAPTPFRLVIDDCHLLEGEENRRIVQTIVEHLPIGSQIAIAGRAEPKLHIARWRAERKVLDIGIGELRLNASEADELLKAAGTNLSEGELSDLMDRTEGWAAGLYFAALARNRAAFPYPKGGRFDGDDRFLTDYIRTEILGRLPPDERRFLMYSSVLDELSGPLCDAALETTGSAPMLEEMDASNRLIVPLDRQRHWYRYHHLFKQMLRDELDRLEPGTASKLALRASAWCEEHGFLDNAVTYAQVAQSTRRVGEIVLGHGLRQYAMGRITALHSWFGWLAERPSVDGAVAVLGAWLNVESGKAVEAASWMKVAEAAREDYVLPDGSTLLAWLLTLRATTSTDALAMQSDAGQATELLAPRSQLLPAAAVMLGVALMSQGDLYEADRRLADAVELGAENRGPGAAGSALALRSMIAIRLGRLVDAEALMERALALVREAHLHDYPVAALVQAVRARVAIRRGDLKTADEAIENAERLRPVLTEALVSRSILVRIELTNAYLGLSNVSSAAERLREARELLRSTRHFDALQAEAEELSAKIEAARGTLSDGVRLTAAEMRLLPLLATQLTFREIGEQLFVSVHTVKAQVTSIYRKLHVSSRTQAIQAARRVGLLTAGP